MTGKFEIFADKAGAYRWELKAGDGQTVASGEGYDTKAAAVRGTEAVQRAAEGATVEDLGASGSDHGGTAEKLVNLEESGF